MNLEIRARDVDLAAAMRSHLQRRPRSSLGRLEDRIRRVTVRIVDRNGPRGGIDKQCRISVELTPSGSFVLEESSTDLVAAIGRRRIGLGMQFPESYAGKNNLLSLGASRDHMLSDGLEVNSR